MNLHPPPWPGLARWLAVLLAGTLPLRPASAEDITTEDCLDCHSSDDDEHVRFRDGSSIPVYVDQELWERSVHGEELDCTDCHEGVGDYPHPRPTAGSAREYRLQQGEGCKDCHYAYYTRMLDGIHYEVLEAGNADAPTCVDCHGAHATTNPRTPRTAVNENCSRCHEEVAGKYRASVHGEAMVSGDPDVPVCTDCHGAHAIRDPRKPDFHVASHEICARCHGDARRMKKYGLNPDVVTTYLDDFHGRSNRLYQQGAGRPGQPMATCTDCHGVHDIQPFEKEQDPLLMKARVVEVCHRCHQDAPVEFAAAWLSHYPPTLASAPLVWGIEWLYRLMIPVILLGLVLHILLHLWRVRTHR